LRNHELTPFVKTKDMVKKIRAKSNPQILKTRKSSNFLLMKNGVITPAESQATAALVKNSAITFLWPIDNLSMVKIIQKPA
jgi:hypothetical protein